MSEQVRTAILLALREVYPEMMSDAELVEASGADVPEIRAQFAILEAEDLAEVVRPSSGYSARLTGAGLLAAEQLLGERRAAKAVFENVETMLGAELPELQSEFGDAVSSELNSLAGRGVASSGAAMKSFEKLGRQEIRKVGQAIASAWTKALTAFPTPVDAQAVNNASLQALEEQAREVTLALNTITQGVRRKNGHEFDLRPALYKTEKRLAAELGLALAQREKEEMVNEISTQVPASQTGTVFIVHGHDEGARESVARFIERLDLEAIILHEQPNKGQTIIEKLERHSRVAYAVVLLTPDDVGAKVGGESDLRPRARQNVIFELGFFVGVLGRERVAALVKGDIERPSDYEGVTYITLDDAGGWKGVFGRELREVGFDIDLDQAL